MKKPREIILIAHNLRSCHNVGSLLRTAEGLGAAKVILSGYTPYPLTDGDKRLPHEAQKLHRQISKTALGAETTMSWQQTNEIESVIGELKGAGFQIFALEQTTDSIAMPDFETPEKLAIVLGREVEGVEPEILAVCDGTLEIPMFGQKESFNVVQAAAMALYHCTFM